MAADFSDGVGANARFNSPQGIEMSADETALFIVDQGNRIRQFLLTTTHVTTATGSGQTSFRGARGLTTAFGIAYGAKWRCDSTTTAECGCPEVSALRP